MAPLTKTSERMVAAAAALRESAARLRFALPVAHVYHPLDYAWPVHEAYLRRYAKSRKRVVFLGMNPGPFGMAQTGVPFGEVAAVRDFLGLRGFVGKPLQEHPKRLVEGFACARSEVSGRRLWGLFAERFLIADDFSESHFVLNYCPLAFLEASGANRTPEKLSVAERGALYQVSDEHLRAVVATLQPEWLIGIGDFAMKRAQQVFPEGGPKIARILHPSPASPAANRGWSRQATQELERLGVWR